MKKTTLVLSVLLLMIHSPVLGNEPVSGKTFLVDISLDNFYQKPINVFYTNYTIADNTVLNVSGMGMGNLKANLNADVDALFLSADNFTQDDLTFIKEWFDLGGKLLWVAGDSDFGGYFRSGDLNPVLEEVGSVLRLDAGSVDDPISNDGTSYRVVANQLGDGPISFAIKKQGTGNSFAMAFHGPTSVYYMNNGVPADLRVADLENVEVVVKSSPDAAAIDLDLSVTADDFYTRINARGDLPMLVVETMGSNAIVVSGEAVFSEYKSMYSNTLEYSGGINHGSLVVDTVIRYLFENVVISSTSSSVSQNTTSSDNSDVGTPTFTLPFSLAPFGLGVLVVVLRRKSFAVFS